MVPSEKDRRRRRRRYPWRRRRRWVLAGVVICMSSAIGGVLVSRLPPQRALEAQMAALRATGTPVTLEEIAEAYAPPREAGDKRNIEEVWGQAPSSPTAEPGEAETEVYVGDVLREWDTGMSLPEEVRELLARRLAENAELLRRLHAQAEIGFAPYPLDLSEGLFMLHPHLPQTRAAARLLRAEAVYAADAGDMARALRSMLTSLAVADSLREEPVLISQLVRGACHSITQAGWRQALALGEFSDAQLVQLQSAFSAAEAHGALAAALAFERSTGLKFCYGPDMVAVRYSFSVRVDKYAPGASRVLAAAGELVGYNAAQQLDYLTHMERLIVSAQKPYPKMLQAMEAAEDVYDAKTTFLPRFADILVGSCSRTGETFARDAANLRMSAAAAAVERYRLVHAAPPDALRDLVPSFLPDVPEDPFDGEALRYRRQGQGYVFYSVGPNREDNGGTAVPRWEGDVVFDVVR